MLRDILTTDARSARLHVFCASLNIAGDPIGHGEGAFVSRRIVWLGKTELSPCGRTAAAIGPEAAAEIESGQSPKVLRIQ